MFMFKKLKNVVYHETMLEAHTADVYLPTSDEDAPLVILVHGGAFQAGSKEMYDAWGPYLAQQGIACMSINYTLSNPHRPSITQILEEMEAATKFVVKQATEWKIDPMKIGFMGDSAGGYLGTMAAFAPERSSVKIKFVISVYGVLDIIEWHDHTNASRTDFVVNKLFGSGPREAKDVYLNASPLHLLDDVAQNPMFDTKFFMIWGEADEVVNPKVQTEAFIKKLSAYGIKHKALAIKDQGHFWFTKNDTTQPDELTPLLRDTVAPKIVEFIYETISF